MTKIRFINLVRVLGLILVLGYHLIERFLPGGFLGVDIFFVISGYLITALIFSEFERNNKFCFVPYIKKRFNRIFPPMLFMVVSTLPFVKLLPDDFTANLSRQIAAVLGFATNYFEIAIGGSYEARLLPHLYIHTWTLGLEVAYYIFWGGFCALIIRSFSNVASDIKNKIIKGILVCSAVIVGALSYINMQYLFNTMLNKSVAYLATTSHIFPFFVGSIVGVLFGFKVSDKVSLKLIKRAKFFKIFSSVVLVMILGVIAYLACVVNYGSIFVYRHGFLLVTILTGLAIVLARILHEVVSKRHKESVIIEHLANISYAMYLFHWPFYIICSNIFPKYKAITTLILSYVFSLIVYYLVDPVFRGSVKKNKKYVVIEALVCIAVVGCTFVDAKVLLNQKDITALENEQMVGNVVQNIDKIENLKIGINNINEEPVLERKGIYNFDKLDVNSTQKQKVSLTPIPEEKNVVNEAKTNEYKNEQQVSNDSSDMTGSKEVKEKIIPVTVDTNVVDTSTLEDKTASSTNPVQEGVRTVTLIGDSVALGARKNIIDTIPNTYADTKGSRNLKQGYSVIMELQQRGELGSYVIVALGTNGYSEWKMYIDKIINDLEPGHRLLFVTPYDGRWNSSWFSYKTTEYLRSIKDTYSFVTIVDWAGEVSKDPSLVGADKIHIGGYTKGIKAFTNKIIEGIEEASKKSTK